LANPIAVSVDLSHLAPKVDRLDAAALEAALEECLAARGTPCVAATRFQGRSSGEAVAATRRLEVQILKWHERVQLGAGALAMSIDCETKVQFIDDDVGPSEQERAKIVFLEKCFESPLGGDALARQVYSAWAAQVCERPPQSFLKAAAVAWAGIDVTCPACGHPHVITDHDLPRFKACMRCGNDAVTGQPEQGIKVAEPAGERTGGAAGLVVLSLLPIAGVWLWHFGAGAAAWWAHLAAHSLGAAGLFWAMQGSLVGRRTQSAAPQPADRRETLAHPEAVEQNQRSLAAAGALVDGVE
jgi:hypothetical protein